MVNDFRLQASTGFISTPKSPEGDLGVYRAGGVIVVLADIFLTTDFADWLR